MSNATGYSISSYGDMMISQPRMDRYVAALRRAVTPGCRVIDLGCGPGIFALLALQFGAAHVDAIEPDPSILVARELAQANGMADRITFFQGLSTAFQPTAPADVLISDIRGNMPLFQHHVPTILDARQRLLRPGGTQIPQGDSIRVALLRNPALTERLHGPWDDRFGLNLRAAARFGVNEMRRERINPADLVSDPADVIRIDYRTVTDPNAQGRAVLTMNEPGTVDGIAIWFDARLDDENGYSNAPDQPDLVYGHSILPLLQPVDLLAGDALHVELRATLVDGSYAWTWTTATEPADGSGQRALYRQSTLMADVIDPARLARRGDRHVPRPHPNLLADRFVLDQVDGRNSLGAIATALRAAFPDLRLSDKESLKRVVAVVNRAEPDEAAG